MKYKQSSSRNSGGGGSFHAARHGAACVCDRLLPWASLAGVKNSSVGRLTMTPGGGRKRKRQRVSWAEGELLEEVRRNYVDELQSVELT